MNATVSNQEQNPFEQSFSSATVKINPYSSPKIVNDGNARLVDVWVSDTSSYSYDSSSINNDVYSVSDHQATSEDSDDTFNTTNPMTYQFEQQRPKRHNSDSSSSSNISQQQYQYQTQFVNNNNMKSTRQPSKTTKKRTRKVKLPEDEEKRKNFLERNRLAALKCRQRKKQWLTNLQARVDYLANDNDQLQMETDALRKEIMDLKTLLVSHKECPQYNAALMNNSTVQHQTQPVYHHDYSMSN